MYTSSDHDPTDGRDTATTGTTSRELGIRELRADLAAAVQRARAGERTTITNHGRAVAQLAPLDEAAPDIDRLIAAGGLVPPRREGSFRPPNPVPVWSGVRVDRALRELRG